MADTATPDTSKAPLHLGEEPKKAKKPAVFIFAAVLAVVGIVLFYRHYMYSSVHVSTDDAAMTAEVIQIAPQVSGTVTKIYVKENQQIKAGDLIAEIDPTTYQTAVDNAKANLDVAEAALVNAQAGTNLTDATGKAQIQQAEGIVSQNSEGVDSARMDSSKDDAAYAVAKAQAASAVSKAASTKTSLNIALLGKQRAQSALRSARASLDSALADVKTAQSNLDAGIATAANAQREAKRLQTLYEQGAISGQAADKAVSAAQVAEAQVSALRAQIVSSQGVVSQRRSDVQSAESQVMVSDSMIAQAKADIAASNGQADAAKELVKQAEVLKKQSSVSIRIAQARGSQANGQLNQAKTATEQLAVSRSVELQAKAKVEQAKAALQEATVQLKRTKIYAPKSGRVTKKSAFEGSLVTPGIPMLVIVNEEVSPWVIANFKETQIDSLKIGQKVEVEVDSFPGRAFKGHVESIAAGTGSTFALLPADNATGNYTKVVQRIPVKVVLDPGQENLSDLRAGMSVVATVSTN